MTAFCYHIPYYMKFNIQNTDRYHTTYRFFSIKFHRKEKHFLLPSVVRTLKYGSVITNQGRGMNPNNGKFTAPTHGVYVFYFSGTALSSTYLQVTNILHVLQSQINVFHFLLSKWNDVHDNDL